MVAKEPVIRSTDSLYLLEAREQELEYREITVSTAQVQAFIYSILKVG